MLSIQSVSEPSVMYLNETNNGFILFTISNLINRHYKIVKETSDGFFNYDFLIDLSMFEPGEPCFFEIPYVDNKFIDSRLPNTAVPLNQTEIGSMPPKAIYKLIYFTADENKETPAKIELNRVYDVGNSIKIKFLYYRVVGNEIYYTGYFGNLFLDNETFPRLAIDISTRLNTIEVSENSNTIIYYILKITSTPNIIFSENIINVEGFSESYTDNGLIYSLELPDNTIVSLGFKCYLTVRDKISNEIINNIENFNILSDTPLTVLGISMGNRYTFTLKMDNPLVEELDFKIVKK